MPSLQRQSKITSTTFTSSTFAITKDEGPFQRSTSSSNSKTNDCIIHELLNRKTTKKRKLEARNNANENDTIHIQNSFNKKQKAQQQSVVQPSTSYMTSDKMNQLLSSQQTTYVPQTQCTNNLNSSQPTAEFDLSDIFFNS